MTGAVRAGLLCSNRSQSRSAKTIAREATSVPCLMCVCVRVCVCVCARCVHGSLCLLVYKCGRDPDLWELQRARCWSRLGHDPGMRFGSIINVGLLLRCRSRRTLLVARAVVLAIVLCLNPFLIQAGACGSGKRRPVQDRTKLTACERCRSFFIVRVLHSWFSLLACLHFRQGS